MFGQKNRKRVYLSNSEEEDIELLNNIFSSSEEENLIGQKKTRFARIKFKLRIRNWRIARYICKHLLVASKFNSKSTQL